MKKSILLVILLALSLGSFSQDAGLYQIYHYFQNGDTIVMSSGGHIRSAASRNSKSIDQLPIGSVLYINAEVESQGIASEVIYNLKSGYYPVRYEIAGEWKTGFLWGGLIAMTHSTDKNNNQYIIGRRSFDTEKYEVTYAVIRIDGATKKIHEHKVVYPLGDQSSFGSKILSNMGLSNINQIYRVGFLGEACGVYTTYHYYAWNGKEFIELPTKNSVGDAGIFGYSETLFFPSEHKYGANFIVVNATTTTLDYFTYNEIEGHEFEVENVQSEVKIYFWDGKKVKLLEPIAIE